MTHRGPTKILTALTALAAAFLGGCSADLPLADHCGSSGIISSTGLAVDAMRLMASMDDDDAVVGDFAHEVIDCATFTVTQPDTNWRIHGTTPAEVDLSSGRYELELDWADDSCSYTSDRISFDVTDDIVTVIAPLCADLAGPWTCADDRSEQRVEARMDGCELELDGVPGTAQVRGHFIDGDHIQGLVSDAGRELSGQAGGEPLQCWR